jgi:ATP-dependent DNA helicase 2 subunit 2
MGDGKGQDPDADIKEIGTVNPIGDFKRMIEERHKDRTIEAILQMSKLILRYISTSMNNNDLYGKAFECLMAMRLACVDNDEAGLFNDLARQLKRNSDFFALM